MIASRLRPPQPLLALVRREELLWQLTTTTAPLVVVCAPGGYGKTVALSQWAAHDGVPFAWLQADAADNDSVLFLHYLTAALGGVVDLEPRITEWLDAAPPPVETRILPALAAAVGSAEPFVLVVDDAHAITNDLCWRIVSVLAEELPPGSHIALSGRAEPPLPLARTRAAGRLLELGPSDLALSPDETSSLLALRGIMADQECVARLTEATEGWAAGVSLAALAWEQASADEVLDGVRGDRHDIARYLASEVLDQQRQDVAAFLLRTSILERLSPTLCRAVTGDDSSGDLLRTVAHGNLFVSSLDETGEWFRYHHLFAEFLQSELARRRGEDEVAALHRRAATWFEEHSALEEAVAHWLAAGDTKRAGAILCRTFSDYMDCARYETLHRWLDSFSDEQIIADHALLLAAAVLGTMAGSSPRARLWLGAALRVEVGDDLWPGGGFSLRVTQAGLRSIVAMEGVAQMHRDAKLALETSGAESSPIHAATTVQFGLSLWLCGRGEEALGYLQEGAREGRVANILAEIAAQGFAALVLADLGRWEEVAGHSLAASRRVEELGLGQGLPTMPAMLAQALTLGHAGDPELNARIEAIAAVVEAGLPPLITLIADVVVADLLLERGDSAGAAAWMRAGYACMSTWPDAGILRDRLQRLNERLQEREQIAPLTPAERRVLELLATELSQPEIAGRLVVSRETVRTHTRDIYRKLDVHTRSQAVARARELGLFRAG